MFPNNSSFDYSQFTRLAECNKQTQTSNPSITDSVTSNAGSKTVVEFNEVLQDPKQPRNITIIKDVFAQESFDHKPNTDSDAAVSNRYTYCREVIQPYLKDYIDDSPVSDEQLVKEVLEVVQKDFPDYQPCFKIYEDKDNTDKKDSFKTLVVSKKDSFESTKFDLTQGSTDNKGTKPEKEEDYLKKLFIDKCKQNSSINLIDDQAQKKCSETFISRQHTCDANTSEQEKNSQITLNSDFENKKAECNTKVPKKKKKCKKKKKSASGTTLSREASSATLTSGMESGKEECPPKERDKRCPKKKHCPPKIEACPGSNKPVLDALPCKNNAGEEKPTCKSLPLPTGSCDEKGKDPEADQSSAKSMRVVAKNVNNEITLKLKDSSTFQSNKPRSLMDTPSETIATIKYAFEDFFGKMYRTTKDAVTMIKSESTRQINRLSGLNSEPNTGSIPRNIECKNSCGVSNINYQENNEYSQDFVEEPGDSFGATAEKVVGKYFSTAKSTLSDRSSQENVQKVSSFTNSQKSEVCTRSDLVSEDGNKSNAGSSVYTAIKSKIVSIFTEAEQNVLPQPSIVSSSSLRHDGI